MQAEKLATEFEKLKYVKQADAGEGEHLKTIRDLQSELEDAKAEALSERKKVIAFFLLLLIIFLVALDNDEESYNFSTLTCRLRNLLQKMKNTSIV